MRSKTMYSPVVDFGGRCVFAAVAGTLSNRVKIAATQVLAVGAPHHGGSTHAWDGAFKISAWWTSRL